MSNVLQEEIRLFRQQHPDIHYVDLLALDLPGHWYGKRYPMAMLPKLAVDGSLRMPQNCILLGQRGQVYPIKHYVYGDGDPDAPRRLVPGSLNPVPWERAGVAQMLITTDGLDSAVAFEPRVVLQRMVHRLQAQGFKIVVAFELEFYLVDEQLDHGKVQFPFSDLGQQRDQFSCMEMDRLTRYSDLMHQIVQCAAQQNIATTIVSPELGPGQFEINFVHDDDPLRAADNSALFCRVVRNVAQANRHRATFMPKPYLDHPGSGMHVHISLYDKAGNNVFAANNNAALFNAIAGCLHLASASTLMFSPHANAMRRYGSGAGNSASTLSWGWDHRGASLRIPVSDEHNRRIEHRLSGADANPYLVLAAILAGIEFGLSQKPHLIPSLNDDAHSGLSMPSDVFDAIRQFEQNDVLSTALGAEFMQVFAENRRFDHREFLNEITAREFHWYL